MTVCVLVTHSQASPSPESLVPVHSHPGSISAAHSTQTPHRLLHRPCDRPCSCEWYHHPPGAKAGPGSHIPQPLNPVVWLRNSPWCHPQLAIPPWHSGSGHLTPTPPPSPPPRPAHPRRSQGSCSTIWTLLSSWKRDRFPELSRIFPGSPFKVWLLLPLRCHPASPAQGITVQLHISTLIPRVCFLLLSPDLWKLFPLVRKRRACWPYPRAGRLSAAL